MHFSTFLWDCLCFPGLIENEGEASFVPCLSLAPVILAGLASLDLQHHEEPSHAHMVFCVFLNRAPKWMCSDWGWREGPSLSALRADSCWVNRHVAAFSDTQHSAVWLFVGLACKQSQLYVCLGWFAHLSQSLMLMSSGLSAVEPIHLSLQRQKLVIMPEQVMGRKLLGRLAPRIWGPRARVQAEADHSHFHRQETSSYPTYKPQLLFCGRNEDLCFILFCCFVLFCLLLFLFVLFQYRYFWFTRTRNEMSIESKGIWHQCRQKAPNR